jgi:hypothetical protein
LLKYQLIIFISSWCKIGERGSERCYSEQGDGVGNVRGGESRKNLIIQINFEYSGATGFDFLNAAS